MSRHGEIVLPFGTEERTFRLGIGQLRAIEEKCDAGAAELMTRLAPLVRAIQAKLKFGDMLAAGLLGTWRVDDIREPILQGLIGGGMTPTDAGVTVRAAFDAEPSLQHAATAFLILQAAWLGPQEDPPDLGETSGATAKAARRSRAARPASRP